MFHKIDMETWERKEYYHYYINFIKSKYNLNVDMDITKLLKLVKEKKLNLAFLSLFFYIFNQFSTSKIIS